MRVELEKKLDPISESVALIYSILVFTILGLGPWALGLGMKSASATAFFVSAFSRAQNNLRSRRATHARVPASRSAMEPRRGNVGYSSLAQLLQFAVESRSGSHGESSASPEASADSVSRCGWRRDTRTRCAFGAR